MNSIFKDVHVYSFGKVRERQGKGEREWWKEMTMFHKIHEEKDEV